MENPVWLKRLSIIVFLLQVIVVLSPLLPMSFIGGDVFNGAGVALAWVLIFIIVQLLALGVFITSFFKKKINIYTILSILIVVSCACWFFIYLPHKSQVRKVQFEKEKKYLSIDKTIELMKFNDEENDSKTIERIILQDSTDSLVMVYNNALEKGGTDRYTISLYYVKNEPNRTLRSEIAKCAVACKSVYLIDGENYKNTTK